MKKLRKMANENFNISKKTMHNTDLYKRKPDKIVVPERSFEEDVDKKG